MTISRNNTHKKNIINNILNKMGIPLKYSSRLVDDITSILIENIIITNLFKIKNFGTFTLKKKNKRIGRNPKNKIIHEILERNVVTFKSSDMLKRRINSFVKE
jgi:integration host factor subunit alpha